MSQKTIPFLTLSPLPAEVINAVNDVMNNGIFFNGYYTESFERTFKEYIGINYFISTANCTDSLEIILRAHEIGTGDEVITSSFTWFSDASVIELVGATPVFADINLSHYGILSNDLQGLIREATKAIILPHLFGMVHPEITAIKQLCEDAGILLIEDCAQAHGASTGGNMSGTFGDVAAFSFYPTKNLGALGDGGCILTNNEKMANAYKKWANHGQLIRNKHVQLGRNSRLDELQAAVLAAKLPFLNKENSRRQELAHIYHQELSGTAIQLPGNYSGHVYHQFVIRTDRREELRQFLEEQGVETDIHYPNSLTQMEVFLKYKTSCQNAEEAAATVLSLPIHPAHTEEEIYYVCEQIKNFFKV
ncbi:aminotransferase DegT [Marivirga lumbricoides]|uniref:Aminotransferase DegT n=1 Tax=Marivirga lumbricoides TaxID=1046115 RepID=A0ABQ1MR86_9BACT|nr:aminotransferase DegT [Marivirga lumbricoides]